MSEKIEDLIIVGSGPSAMSAAIYTARENIETTIYEKSALGGVVSIIDKIDNYPGYPDGVSGFDLATNFEKQAKRFGANIEYGQVESISNHPNYKEVVVDGKVHKTKAVLIATGRSYGDLGVKGEEEYVGRGIHYCATCDGAFYRGKKLAVVGGANSAVQEAMFLLKFAEHVDLLVRSTIKCSEILKDELDKLVKAGSVTVHLETTVREFVPVDNHIKKILITEKGKDDSLDVDGVFIFTGMKPSVKFLKDSGVELTEDGYIKTNAKLETNVPGIFASGDVRHGSTKQIASAVGEGATVAASIRDFLKTI